MNWLFFLEQQTVIVLIITSLALTIAMTAEMFWPRRALGSSLSWRWGNNLALGLVTWYVAHLANYGITLGLAYQTELHQLGLFQQFAAGFWLPLGTIIVVSQFFNYVTHVIFHHVAWLWPLHAIHHSDVDVDISTSYRHHPLEPVVFMPLLIPAILLLGIPVEAMFTYHVITIFMTVFSHSNLRLPANLDLYLSKIVVTPDFHRVHHSSDSYYTNSNYGGIVPWFDYLFGTAKKRGFKDHETFELGLEYSRDRSSSRFDKMLLSPLHRVETTEESS